MKVVVIGALGKVARHLLPLLAGRGDDVVGVVRKPAQLDEVTDLGAEALLLDIEQASTEEIASALDGADAVVWSAGAGGGNPDRTYAVDRDAAIRSMDAAANAGVPRYVMVSWIGSVPDHDIPADSSFYAYADAKLAADDHLRGTALDWTILGPGSLTDDDPTGRIERVAEGVSLARGEDSAVPRADVAQVVAESLREPTTVGRFVRFRSGETPVVDALRG
ncbi:SDR family oxidoreductase [Isoptericola sp. S6320L]|uniref:SDR family oxidoreductase n=1 Tax=Isoptericola sp. S6320L TaxID=2926411 RepID=UPI001FF3855C|nr:SDR family oxidoreductase [Isoptericola sp. S6320L]MCK0117603.1 SDR family oxidoreductase [Isoptericola sp. S6320L]